MEQQWDLIIHSVLSWTWQSSKRFKAIRQRQLAAPNERSTDDAGQAAVQSGALADSSLRMFALPFMRHNIRCRGHGREREHGHGHGHGRGHWTRAARTKLT